MIVHATMPATLEKRKLSATPTECISLVSDEGAATVAQCSSELVESEGGEEDDDDP